MILVIGCAPKKLIMKQNPQVQEIAICLETGTSVPYEMIREIDSVTTRFIDEYNSGNNSLRLLRCQNDSRRTMYLDVLTINITDPGIQGTGVFLTTLGTITPFVMLALNSPVYIWFGYLPRSRLLADVRLSEDISDPSSAEVRRISPMSPKYFGSYENQKRLLLEAYHNTLKQEVYLLENNRVR